ncbi:phosphatase PAP2 family protein [Puia sp. P3]|uniref:phosphatase PAP2 family protein n=1 Tax=Puia sp. P3 TaxID=3423952 RepID=UPI003D67F6BF
MKTIVLALAFFAFVGCCFLYGGFSDMAFIRSIHLGRLRNADSMLQFISNTTAFFSFGLILPFLLVYVSRRRSNNAVLLKRDTGRKALIEGVTLLCSLLLTTLLVQALKHLIDRPRPYEVYSFIKKLSDAGGGSFPSGHTADAFTVLAFFMLGRYSLLFVLPILVWAFAVGYTRIALGVHYGSDVLGAMLLGILSAWAGRKAMNAYFPISKVINKPDKT